MAKASTASDTTETSNGSGKLPDPNAETIDIVWRGVTVTIPKRRGRWDIDALVDFQDGKPLPGLRRLLGPNQWARVKRVGPTGDDLDEFSSVAADVINEQAAP